MTGSKLRKNDLETRNRERLRFSAGLVRPASVAAAPPPERRPVVLRDRRQRCERSASVRRVRVRYQRLGPDCQPGRRVQGEFLFAVCSDIPKPV